VRSGSRRLHH